ncbi:MAG: hypothetical protein R6V84_02650 [Desulfobacterales bacterium]
MQTRIKVILIAVLSLVVLSATGAAAEADAMKGWGTSDPYNTFYNAKELERFKATVVKIVEVVPMPGMSPGIALEVREGSEIILVHLGPAAFFKQADIGMKPGDRVDVRGCWAEINGKDVLMASKVKKGKNFELKVRLTKDGTPFWSMTPEQLAKEQKNQSN